MKSFLEWYLGIPPAEPGHGTQWSWLSQTPWPSGMPAWVVVLLMVTSVLYVGWVCRRDAKSASLPARVLLTGLRLASIALVVLVLTELTLIVERTGLPFVAVLVDDSASMGLEDQYQDRAEAKAAAQWASHVEAGKSSRLEIAQGMLVGNGGEFLKRLQQRHQLRVYRFSETASPLGGLESEDGSGLDELLTAIRKLEATGTDTRPAQAVRKVLNDFRGSLPSAIVVLSDGISSTGDQDQLTAISELAARRLVPLYTIGIGSEAAMHDLNLYDTLVDEVAFVDDPVAFTSKLKSFGFKGKSVKLTLREKGKRDVLATKTVRAVEDGQSLPVELTWVPKQAGDYEVVLEATPQPSEVDRTNNSETRQISVREGRIRVLLIDSAPRWEFRELKTLLEREKTVELHTVLQEADLEFADQDATAQQLRGRFPVNRDQLFAYDVVIFGDVNPEYLSPAILENLGAFVSEAGGGLIMVAGNRFNPVEYAGTPLQTLLPVELDGVKVPSPDQTITQSFAPQLTLEGQKSTPIFRFDEDEASSRSIWKGLPGLYWFIETPNVKRGATVFVEHPSRMGTGRHLPIVVMQRFGAGKVLLHTTDETWLWRRKVGDLYFGRYWIQAIRYLSRSRLIGQSKTAELKSDRLVYNRGETVTLRVRFFNEEQLPGSDEAVRVVVERRGAGTQEVELTRVAQAPNVFEGQYRRPIEGTYHAWIAHPEFADSAPSTDFRVEAPERELRIRGLDRRQLTEAAETTRGRFYSLASAGELPDDVPRGRPVPIRSEEPIRIWNRWEIMVLLTLLLTTEWLLRKRGRLV